MRHAWRYRTARMRRLRRLVAQSKCLACGHNRWIYEGIHAYDPVGSGRYHLYTCARCGGEDAL